MRIIDLRSDTVTRPTEAMREAMRTCPVGDDVFMDDPSIIELEELGAKMLGMEAAIFVPTGTFGNQLGLFTHCQRGDEIIIGDSNHVLINEQAGPAVIAGVQTRTIDVVKGYMDPAVIESKIRQDDNIHHPRTTLICTENAHSSGHVMTLENMRDIYAVGQKYGIPVHCDGARLFNAAVSLGVPVSELGKYLDSVSVCLSKGLCAPVGSFLAGKKDFIKLARRRRKVMGGGMRQAGVLAAPGIIALKEMSKRLHIDHENAKHLAKEISGIPGISLDIEDVQINMVFFNYTSEKMTADEFYSALEKRGVLLLPRDGRRFRLACHNDVSAADIDEAIGHIRELLS